MPRNVGTLNDRHYFGNANMTATKPDTIRLSSPPFISCHAQSFQPRMKYGSVKGSSSSFLHHYHSFCALYTLHYHSFQSLFTESIKCSRRLRKDVIIYRRTNTAFSPPHQPPTTSPTNFHSFPNCLHLCEPCNCSSRLKIVQSGDYSGK